MQAILTIPDVQLYEKHTLSYYNVLSFSKIFSFLILLFIYFDNDLPEPTWTTAASLISSNDHKLYFHTYQSLEIIIDHNIKQYSCDAGIVTAPTVFEVTETLVPAGENKR